MDDVVWIGIGLAVLGLLSLIFLFPLLIPPWF
jgi:hypothetical protein